MNAGIDSNINADEITVDKKRVRKFRRVVPAAIAVTTLLGGGAAFAVHQAASATTPQAAQVARHVTTSRPVASSTPHVTAKATKPKPKLIPIAGVQSQSFDDPDMTPGTSSLLGSINSMLAETGDMTNRVDDGQPLTPKEAYDGEQAEEHPIDADLIEGLNNDITGIEHGVANSNEERTYGGDQVDGNGDTWVDEPGSGWTSTDSPFTTPPFWYSDAQ